MSSQYIELQSVATDESYEGSYEPYQRRGQEEYRASNLPVSNWASFKEQFLSLPYGGLDKVLASTMFLVCMFNPNFVRRLWELYLAYALAMRPSVL